MIEDPLEKFKLIYQENPAIARSRGRISEADTRANVLDRIIHEVLEWPRADVKREPFANPGYIDYLFSHGRPVFLLEAKAEGETFSFPYRSVRRRRAKISGALMSDKTIEQALSQAQGYCSRMGVRYGVATNGWSFIIFRVFVEGISWREDSAIVFYDYNDVVKNFTDFWNMLSYEAVIDGKLSEVFRGKVIPSRGYYRPISKLVDADATYGRNPLNKVLRPYVEKFFGDIATQDPIDVLKLCYVNSKPIQTIDEDLKLIINDQIPRFARGAEEISTRNLEHEGSIGAYLRETVEATNRQGAIALFMGGIGCGKSTFCKRFFRVVAPELVEGKSSALLVYLNFLGAPDHPEQLDLHLWKLISASIKLREPSLVQREMLDKIFADEIGIITSVYGKNGVDLEKIIADKLYKDVSSPREFAEAALRYCAKCGRMPIVVFDNVDQLRIEAQTQLFVTAQRFANLFGCFSLVVLREESYSAALMKRHLTASNIRPYHLSSPRFKDLLKERINLAANEAVNASTGVTATEEEKGYAQVITLFRLLRSSLLGRNKNIIRLVESVAYGNMRLALLLFNSFITSGATNMRKILDYYLEGKGYTVPFHEFAKSIMLGDYRYYKESRSLILNVFNVTGGSNASHFTTLRILKYLANLGATHQTGEGFVSLQRLLNVFCDIFENEEDVKLSILRLIDTDKQIVELDTRRCDTFQGARSLSGHSP